MVNSSLRHRHGRLGKFLINCDSVVSPSGVFILTTNLAACVFVRAKFDQFLPARFHFKSKRSENFVRIAKFPYAAFGPLFAFHCPLFFYEKQ